MSTFATTPQSLVMPQQAAAFLFMIMAFKVFLTNMIQGNLKRKANLGPKEDWNSASGFTVDGERIKQAHAGEVVTDPEAVARHTRWSSIQANDAENVPYGLMAGVFSAIAVSNPLVPDSLRSAQIAFFALYVFFRILHTLIYAYGIQPWRSIVYAVAQTCFFALCCCFIASAIIQ